MVDEMISGFNLVLTDFLSQRQNPLQSADSKDMNDLSNLIVSQFGKKWLSGKETILFKFYGIENTV